MTAAGINACLREVAGGDFTAKDFRTWNATAVAAAGLAVSQGAGTAQAAPRAQGARQRAVIRVVQEVAGYLGNTPAVARASCIDPRVIDRYEDGATIRRSSASSARAPSSANWLPRASRRPPCCGCWAARPPAEGGHAGRREVGPAARPG